MRHSSAFLAAVLGLAIATEGCGVSERERQGGCASNKTECGGDCVDLRSNEAHCGECGAACETDEVCEDRRCSLLSCEGGSLACAGRCVQPDDDPDHCGRCGNACAAGGVCAAGRCLDRCPEDTSVCGRSCVDLLSATEHCGQCNRACTAPGAAGFCLDGDCAGFACTSGRLDEDGDPSNGCEGTCEPVAIAASGALDFDLRVIRVSGRVTVGGMDPGPSTVISRGILVFRRAGSTKHASVDLGANGAATYQIDLFAGTYAVELVNELDCLESSPFACGAQILRTAIDLAADGALDLDAPQRAAPIPPVSISGRVTANGAALSMSFNSLGTLRFVPADPAFTGSIIQSAEIDGTNGTYQVSLTPGMYRVLFDPAIDCGREGTLPCQSRTLSEARAFPQSGVFDLDTSVITVTGALAQNGVPLALGADGPLAARFLDSEGAVEATVSETSPISYRVLLFGGTYDIFAERTSCANSTSVCGARTFRRDVVLAASGALDLDLPVRRLVLHLKHNGSDPPVGSEDGRGAFQLTDPENSLSFDLPASGPAEVDQLIFAGTYELHYSGPRLCSPGSPHPCQSRTLERALNVQADTDHNGDLPVIQVSGTLSKNGVRLGAGLQTCQLSFAEDDPLGGASAPLDATARFDLALLAGDYAITFDGTNCSSVELPAQSALLTQTRLSTSGSLDLNLRTARIIGAVTANQLPLPDTTQGRGELFFAAEDGSYATTSLPIAGPATYAIELVQGRYSVLFNRATCDDLIPCQSAMLKEDLNLITDSALDLDLPVIDLSGQITVNGAAMSQSAGGLSRGELKMRSDGAEGGLIVDLGTNGPAAFLARVIAGQYHVSLEGTDCALSQSALPCADILLRGCPP